MFGYAAGRSAYPQVYSVNKAKRNSPKREASQSISRKEANSAISLRPAIDGPPSPERIRAYTEQMKRNSIFGNNSRTNTFSSTTPSFRSRDSVSMKTDSGLSRKTSNGGNMPSTRSERPESIQIFGSIFSRSGRKNRKDIGTSASSSTPAPPTPVPIEEETLKDDYQANEQSRRPPISTPYNFQHLTHTRQEHLPNLEKSSRTELVSEFSAIRASQAPSKGELRGIRAEDLYFENFSSEALSSPVRDDDLPPPIMPKNPRRQRSVLRKSGIPARLGARSQDNLRSAQPSQSPLCPIELPARTSSRTASVIYDNVDHLATTTLERPLGSVGFRRPSPLAMSSPPLVPPPAPAWSEQDVYFADLSMSHAVTTPGDEAWPLSSSGIFGGELPDVKEEEDESGPRPSGDSHTSNELRTSQSVPALRLMSQEQDDISQRSEARISTTLGPGSVVIDNLPVARQQLPPTFQGIRDSWEDDVDFCYENEIEADFDYQWDRCDINGEGATPAALSLNSPQLALHLEDDDRVYQGRFRPSLLVPSASDIPDLSPMSSISSPTNDPRTPSSFLRPSHARALSHASSFKESHGFTLSPTLLIPADFQSQMDQEPIFDEHYHNHANSGAIFHQERYTHSASPVDESICSTASYRSSDFSRGSARSSSSTRISTAHSRGSQDSAHLISRAASVNYPHRSVSSASSLPDLIPSVLRNDVSSESESLPNLTPGNGTEESLDSAPAPDVPGPASVGHRRHQSLAGEPGLRKGANYFAPTSDDSKNLSPVAETFDAPKATKTSVPYHGRKYSVPLAAITTTKEIKGRARASTVTSAGKPKGGYVLFPQI